MSLIRPAASLLLIFTVVTGLLYPAVITGIARVAFPSQARGSLIEVDGRVVGSRFIGQPFDDPRYFWGRPSATGTYPNNAAASSGSNQGPLNPALHDAVAARIAALHDAQAGNEFAIPVDLVTASGSGLDPHVSLATAYYQADRVARERGLSLTRVRELIDARIEGRTFGLLGEPRVNVLLLNLDLDRAERRE
jgi:potassium-transporting ATPase KdpC subunit